MKSIAIVAMVILTLGASIAVGASILEPVSEDPISLEIPSEEPITTTTTLEEPPPVITPPTTVVSDPEPPVVITSPPAPAPEKVPGVDYPISLAGPVAADTPSVTVPSFVGMDLNAAIALGRSLGFSVSFVDYTCNNDKALPEGVVTRQDVAPGLKVVSTYEHGFIQIWATPTGWIPPACEVKQ